MPRKEYVLYETRRISGRGLFKRTPQPKDRHFLLYTNLIREPRVNFSNSKYNPDKSEYAKITWLKGGYVLREDVVHFEYQLFQWRVDPTGYLATAIPCMYRSIMDYLDYLAPFVGAPPLVTDPTDPIYVEPLLNNFDEIRIVCRGDAALECELYELEYDWQCPEGEPTPKEPPIPPPSERNPPGTPLEDISPPYDYSTNDDENTSPSDLDEFPPEPPPPPDDCSLWQIVYRSTLFNGQQIEQIHQFKYPYSSPVIGGTANSEATVQHSGAPAQACSTLAYSTVVQSFSPGAFPPPAVIISIEVASETLIS